jgi:hypothetical protein
MISFELNELCEFAFAGEMDDGLMMNTLHWDIIELAGHLRQERLFVSSEQQHLQGLNEKVRYCACIH